MEKKSNITAGSNVYLTRTKEPWKDPEFVAKIQDYKLLKAFEEKYQGNSVAVKLSKKQREILSTELRCVYAKNDPCWGYSEEKSHVISSCINGKCPNIKKCNPSYNPVDASYWKTSDEEKKLYGNPGRQPLYYIVDMVSDEEMKRYIANPKNEGAEYQVPPNPVLIDKRDKIQPYRQTKIDRRTGRKMVVIGRKWMITDNASYESEEIVPIWGFVDEVKEKTEPQYIKRAKRITKKHERSKERKNASIGNSKKREDIESTIKQRICDEIKLTEIDLDIIGSYTTAIVLDNPAELAFVSGTFLTYGIDHGIYTPSNIVLFTKDKCESATDFDQILISSTLYEKGIDETNLGSWEAISEKERIGKLDISRREYYKFESKNGFRWVCRNMYGVTHICVYKKDIMNIDTLPDGEYPIEIIPKEKNYFLIVEDGSVLGSLKDEFSEIIGGLIDAEEISGIPAKIKGVELRICNGKMDVLGMGHLKFNEY